MLERLKAIWEKIKDFWLKFNKKQRILFISIFVVIVIAIIVLARIVGKTEMVKLRSCSSDSEAVEVRQLLRDNGFSSVKIDENNVIYVSEKEYQEAK